MQAKTRRERQSLCQATEDSSTEMRMCWHQCRWAKNLLLRDALVNGVHSDEVRVQLLELEDNKAKLSDCIAVAIAVEMSSKLPKSFKTKTNDT